MLIIRESNGVALRVHRSGAIWNVNKINSHVNLSRLARSFDLKVSLKDEVRSSYFLFLSRWSHSSLMKLYCHPCQVFNGEATPSVLRSHAQHNLRCKQASQRCLLILESSHWINPIFSILQCIGDAITLYYYNGMLLSPVEWKLKNSRGDPHCHSHNLDFS